MTKQKTNAQRTQTDVASSDHGTKHNMIQYAKTLPTHCTHKIHRCINQYQPDVPTHTTRQRKHTRQGPSPLQRTPNCAHTLSSAHKNTTNPPHPYLRSTVTTQYTSSRNPQVAAPAKLDRTPANIDPSTAQATAPQPRCSEYPQTGWGDNDNHWDTSPDPTATNTMICTFCPHDRKTPAHPTLLRAPDRPTIDMHSTNPIIVERNNVCRNQKPNLVIRI